MTASPWSKRDPLGPQCNQWFKSYGHFTEGVDFAYWWSFGGGGSAINEATPSSLYCTVQYYTLLHCFILYCPVL